jgi:FAD:protein FMN transferase
LLEGETMGTTWSVRAAPPPSFDHPGEGRGSANRSIAEDSLRAEIESVLTRIVAEMSHWDPTSQLSRFNASEPGRWQPLPPGFAHVLATALDIAHASDGAFDPAMGRLADLWGFGPTGPRTGIPSDAEIADTLHSAGHRRIEQDTRRARRHTPAALDFSGIAKGHAVDAVAERLRGLGLRDFLAEIGGELRGEGIKPDGQPWWVDLEPAPGTTAAPIRVALHGLAIATSGDYRRSFRHQGRDYAHTLDPRTGRPLANGVASVTVLHPSCMHADAWATALTVLGPEGMKLAEREGLAAHMVVRGGREHLSPAFAQMLA